MAMSKKIGRPTVKKNGKPLSNAERKRRYRANLKRKDKAAREAERTARRIETCAPLDILPLAIADITDAN
jgi:hypothetical protein